MISSWRRNIEKRIADLERRLEALETPEDPDNFPRERWRSLVEISAQYGIPATTLRYRCKHKLLAAKQMGKVWLIDSQNLPDEWEIDEDA